MSPDIDGSSDDDMEIYNGRDSSSTSQLGRFVIMDYSFSNS